MYSKTQMINIKRPKLFYLFRKALGFLFLFAFCEFFNGQITVVGEVQIIDYTQIAPVNISSGAYVFDTAKDDKIIIKKNLKTKVASILKTRKKYKANGSVTFKKIKIIHHFQYNNIQSTEIMRIAAVINFFGTNNSNFNNKVLHLFSKWNFIPLVNNYTDNNNLIPFLHQYLIYFNSQQARPPPIS